MSEWPRPGLGVNLSGRRFGANQDSPKAEEKMKELMYEVRR